MAKPLNRTNLAVLITTALIQSGCDSPQYTDKQISDSTNSINHSISSLLTDDSKPTKIEELEKIVRLHEEEKYIYEKIGCSRLSEEILFHSTGVRCEVINVTNGVLLKSEYGYLGLKFSKIKETKVPEFRACLDQFTEKFQQLDLNSDGNLDPKEKRTNDLALK